MNAELQRFRALIADSHYKIVSFDLFDTLIRRKVVSPDHVFWTIGEKFEVATNGVVPVEGFYNARHLAGHLSQNNARKLGREDTTLREIYDVFVSVIPEAYKYKEFLIQLEMDEEAKVLEVYPFGKELFDFAKAKGKKILIASDQYLPIEFLKKLIEDMGYVDYEHFFLSGDVGLLKTTGSLYEWITMRFDVKRDEVLHIGDNQYVDEYWARRKGLMGVVSPRSDRLAGHAGVDSAIAVHPSLASYAVANYVNTLADQSVFNGKHNVRAELDFVGYCFYGPILTYLAHWLAQKLNGEVDRIWMLARDGEGLFKAFKCLYPELSDRVDYVYASRRMLVYPTGELSGAEVFRHYSSMIESEISVNEFLKHISSQLVDFTRIAHAFDKNDKVNVPYIREKLKVAIDEFCAELKKECRSSEDNGLRDYYLSQTNGATKIGVFDIGWRGNLQRGLENILSNSGIEIKGYYIGKIYEDELYKNEINSDSFAFSYNYPPQIFEDISHNIWPLEFIFGGTELSAIGVRKNNHDWQPIFENNNSKKDKELKFAHLLQESAIRFIHDFKSWDKDIQAKSAQQKQAVKLICEFLARPRRCDAEIFHEFTWAMNIDDGAKSLIAVPKNNSGRQISKARSNSSWPAGFDAMQSHQNLRSMRKYWRRRHKIKKIMRKIKDIIALK
ncbi:hypothetical protein KQ944_07765 [Bacillus subtilis]|uniref:HAD family hydrolase n=1 Tax=Pseudochrobactrum asaccharolyticum TaxID=354351 RepID=UPI001F4817C9|nr:HAD family hydrolase [Pseudochrobactrum asaccharolyticum]MCF7645052.1 hypothetical protein [Pseudochrobactrum asaccharolyticum]MCF7671519.1 hypothetical protein [Bacillus subtilis]